MDRKKLIFLLAFLIIIVGIILALLLTSSFNKSTQEINCNVQGPFDCKEVKFNSQQTYILLEAKNIQELRIIPESINISNCLAAYIDQSLLTSSTNKYVKISLECSGAVETSGSLEMLYMTLDGDVQKAKLIFSAKMIPPLFKRIVGIFTAGGEPSGDVILGAYQ